MSNKNNEKPVFDKESYKQKIKKMNNKELFKYENEIGERNAVWSRLKNGKNDLDVNGRREFLQMCLQENLGHARHVETERLTFNSIFLALVAGGFAIGSSLNKVAFICLIVALFVAGIVAMLLTGRWNLTFQRHMYLAEKCYVLLHKELFGDSVTPDDEFLNIYEEKLDGLNEVAMIPFRIRKGYIKGLGVKKVNKIKKTQGLYNLFYIIIEATLVLLFIYTLIFAK